MRRYYETRVATSGGADSWVKAGKHIFLEDHPKQLFELVYFIAALNTAITKLPVKS